MSDGSHHSLAGGNGAAASDCRAAERRGSARLQQSSLVLLRPEESTNGEPKTAWLVDVSGGGVALQAPPGHGLESETLMMIELPLGTSISRIKTRCRIVGISSGDPQIVRMEFLDDSELFRQTLEGSLRVWELRNASTRFHGEWR